MTYLFQLKGLRENLAAYLNSNFSGIFKIFSNSLDTISYTSKTIVFFKIISCFIEKRRNYDGLCSLQDFSQILKTGEKHSNSDNIKDYKQVKR